MAHTYVARTHCRLCASAQLDEILSLGELAFSAFPLPGSLDRVHRAPLTFCLCRTCGLAQLRETVRPELMFKTYWYRSAINEAMQAELTHIVRSALLEVSVYAPHDLVVDVGANDGYLLSQYPKHRVGWEATRIAFEPAQNLQADCKPHAEILIQGFFPDAAPRPAWKGRVKILTSIAMFYDLDDPASFVREVDRILHRDGVWIVQLQDLAQMIEATAFDNLCHEHLTYWSFETFVRLLDTVGADLHITRAERRPINGGSLRLYIRRTIYPQAPSVGDLRAEELAWTDWRALEHFAWATQEVKKQIRATIEAAVQGNQTIDLYGASTKANTLLQTCFLTASLVRQAWERNPEKIGRLTATGIPIVSEEDGRADPPAVLLAGIWQFRDVILARESAYLAGGGRILFPLPVVDLVTVERDAAS